MKTFKRETLSKISKVFLGSFLCCLMIAICQRRRSKLLGSGTYRHLSKYLNISGGSETQLFAQSIYDSYDFSAIEKPQLWKDGGYSSLYNLTESEQNSFLQFKEEQYLKRSAHITKQCTIIQAVANHTSQKSTSCSISGGKLLLLEYQQNYL